MADISPRHGMPSSELSEAEFKQRYRQQFFDPAFDGIRSEIERIADVAWDGYVNSRKSPVTTKAGSEFSDPAFDLSVDWMNARAAVHAAQAQYEDKAAPLRVLIINGSSRSENTCPGEMSKTWRLVCLAENAIKEKTSVEVDILDLSRLASEYGRHIHPCKACFSTAAPLCHWPCSCYPNHSLGQTQDWMNEIYPMWVAAHGIMVISPVNWYHVSSPVKLMIDRLVCADGGNPDPTLTGGKDAEKAKQIELDGWHYPRHLAGRLFSVVIHGDAEGAENVRRSISDWLRSMKLISVGAVAELDRYIGYWKPYATSHEDLDNDRAIQIEVENAALALAEGVMEQRAGRFAVVGAALQDPREK